MNLQKKIMWLTQEQQPPQKAEGNFIRVQSGYFSPAFSRQSKADLNLWWEEEGCTVVIIYRYLPVPAYKGASIHVHTLSFGSIAFARIWFPSDFFMISSKILRGSLLIWLPFSSEVRWPCLQLLKLALGTAVVASRNQHKSTEWGSTITVSTALLRALNSHPRLKKKKSPSVSSLPSDTQKGS